MVRRIPDELYSYYISYAPADTPIGTIFIRVLDEPPICAGHFSVLVSSAPAG